MKAIIWTKYGAPDVLQLQNIPKPTPKDNEILIRVVAASVTMGDCEMRNLRFPWWIALPMRGFVGLRKPTRIPILGMELSGQVEAVGAAVTRFKVGDDVFSTAGFQFGAYAEYICLAADNDEIALTHKPNNLSYEEAAVVPIGGLEALHFVGQAKLQAGQRILINGAGGTIGTYAIQLAKLDGAEVTAVDSTDKLEMMRSIGADHVIDFKQEDFTRRNETYDVILDVVGKAPFGRALGMIKEGGLFLIANPRIPSMTRGAIASATSSKKVIFGAANQETAALVKLRELIEAGKLKPIIGHRYAIEDVVAAHELVESGQKIANLVLNIGQ